MDMYRLNTHTELLKKPSPFANLMSCIKKSEMSLKNMPKNMGLLIYLFDQNFSNFIVFPLSELILDTESVNISIVHQMFPIIPETKLPVS